MAFTDRYNDIDLKSNIDVYNHKINGLKTNFHFEPASGWKEIL